MLWMVSSLREGSSEGGLPSGEVTFLFTDIEGSTRLLSKFGALYQEVLDRHREVLNRVWTDHGGCVVRIEGDGCFVSFSEAADAVQAAVEAQRALAVTEWPQGVAPRVRMGLHTGYARPRDGDYVALAVHQAARIVGAAHGGQVLVSSDTASASGPDVDPGLVPLGRFRVRDFDEPPVLYRAEADGWTDPERPPRVPPADGHNLVRPLSALVGRERDRDWALSQILPGTITSIVGPGGVGKTRLMVEIGLEVAERWADGAWMVELAPVRAPERVANAVADGIGAEQVPGVPPIDDLRRHLRSRETLLLLDNCEHMVDAVARLVHEIVASCPNVGVLATSRVPLGLQAESVRRLAPLAVGEDSSPAVQLFLERAPQVPPDQLPAVRDLCRQLDGLPLAIELAAARARSVPPAAILQRLEKSPTAIRNTDPTRPDRHRSLDRVLDWSRELLDPPTETALRRLAVFSAGFDLPLAGVACAEEPITEGEVPNLVWTLVDHSLVAPDTAAGSSRYRLPVVVRAYAAELRSEAETQRTVTTVADHYLAELGPEQATDRVWVSAMSAELDNVRGIIRDLSGVDDERAQTLAWSVGRYHEVTSAYATGIEETAEHLELLPSATPARVGLLILLTSLHLNVGEVDRGEAILDEAEAMATTTGEPGWDDVALVRRRGIIALRRREYALAERLGNMAVADASGPHGRAGGWNVIGLANAARGRLDEAIEAFERELEAESRLGMETFLINTRGNLAEANFAAGRRRHAARHQLACLDLARANDAPIQIGYSIMIAARLAADAGDTAQAVTLHRAALDALDTSGHAMFEFDVETSERFRAQARDLLGDGAFDAAEAEGTELDLATAADLAGRILAFEISDRR